MCAVIAVRPKIHFYISDTISIKLSTAQENIRPQVQYTQSGHQRDKNKTIKLSSQRFLKLQLQEKLLPIFKRKADDENRMGSRDCLGKRGDSGGWWRVWETAPKKE